MKTGTIIKANNAESNVKVAPKNGKDFSLGELNTIVDGYIEIVRIPNSKDILIVNEDGLQKNLPYNVLASVYANQRIVGNVLRCNKNMVK